MNRCGLSFVGDRLIKCARFVSVTLKWCAENGQICTFPRMIVLPLLLAVFDEVAKADLDSKLERMRLMLALGDLSCALYQPFYCFLFIVHCWLFTVYCLLFIVCCQLFIVYCCWNWRITAVPSCKIQLRSTVEKCNWEIYVALQDQICALYQPVYWIHQTTRNTGLDLTTKTDFNEGI